MKYYMLHVFINRYEGYSTVLSTDKELDEEELLQLAREEDIFTLSKDWVLVDTIEEIDYEEYKNFIK